MTYGLILANTGKLQTEIKKSTLDLDFFALACHMLHMLFGKLFFPVPLDIS